MLKIQVLGPGCANCQRLETLARQAVAGLGVEVVTLAPVSQTLEEVYLQVVKEDEAQEATNGSHD